LNLTQKHFSTHIEMNFGERELAYKIRDNSGEREMAVDYGRIPKQGRKVFDRNTWLRNVGIMWCLLGVGLIVFGVVEGRPATAGAFWLFVGVGCLVAFRVTGADYTVFDTQDGAIFILQSAGHDQVLSEIDARRKAVLQKWFHELDFGEDEGARRQTIDFMRKQGAFTPAEADAILRSPIEDRAPKLIGPEIPPDRKLH
jgi:hypothetical protein